MLYKGQFLTEGFFFHFVLMLVQDRGGLLRQQVIDVSDSMVLEGGQLSVCAKPFELDLISAAG